MQKIGFVVSVIYLLSLVACGSMPPKPNESEYFVSIGGGFIFDGDSKTAKYGLTIASKGKVATGNVIEARFENPTGGQYLTQTITVEKGQIQFEFASPPVDGLKAHTIYMTEFFLYASSSKDVVLGTHNQSLQNLIDQSDLNGYSHYPCSES